MKLINGWTKQRVMEQVKKYNNGTKAYSHITASCEYLTDNNRCAVGCFIPDGHEALYTRMRADKLLERYPELSKVMPFSPTNLIVFQNVHDFTKNGESTYDRIEDFLDTSVR